MKTTIKMLTGILIDPFAKTVTMVEVVHDLSAYYKLLDCDLVDVIRLTPHVDLWIDDEGLLKEPPNQAYFYLGDYPSPIAGRALLLGHDKEGNSRSLRTTEEEIVAHVMFVNTTIKGFRAPQPESPEIWALGEDFNSTHRLD
jgi:Domain of unknown function (DUF3846)